MKTKMTFIAAACSLSLNLSAAGISIEYTDAPPAGLPAETGFRNHTATNTIRRFADMGEIAKIQIRYLDTNRNWSANALTQTSVSNYLQNIIRSNPELYPGPIWAEGIASRPEVEAYVTFKDGRSEPSRWLIWPGRAVFWSPTGRWVFMAWMRDAPLRQVNAGEK